MRSATIINGDNPQTTKVSIHALLAECDSEVVSANRTRDSFNPRTPCGVRLNCKCKCKCSMWFQSTHSLRSATYRGIRGCNGYRVSIHALLAECDSIFTGAVARTPVSIHALLAECDRNNKPNNNNRKVSIHALLAECDRRQVDVRPRSHRFNPRTPCGVRPATGRAAEVVAAFQSTHSLRSATLVSDFRKHPLKVSIHALLAECDF